jgi:hypothetical protein
MVMNVKIVLLYYNIVDIIMSDLNENIFDYVDYSCRNHIELLGLYVF